MSKKKKPEKETFPPVAWSANSHELIWALIAEVERPKNQKVIVGKLKTENSSGDHKIQAYKRVAEKVLPVMFQVDSGSAASRIKSKWESLRKTYSAHAKRLYQTGGGVQDGETQETDEYSSCYIPPDGPDATTNIEARNIWDEIQNEFTFFSTLHRFLSTCPNVTPIAVTTGVGPLGQKIVHYQPPDGHETGPQPDMVDMHIDPALRNTGLEFNSIQLPPSQGVHGDNPDKENMPPPLPSSAPLSSVPPPSSTPQSSSTPQPSSAPPQTPARGPKASTFGPAQLDAAIAKASSSIKPVRQKRSIEETFVDMQKRTLKLSKARMKEESEQKRIKLANQDCELCLREYEAGVLTLEEYREARRIAASRRHEVIFVGDSSDIEIDEDVKPFGLF